MSRVRSVAVVGLGLIGGSFEKAARAAGYEVFALHHGDALPDFGREGERHETGDLNLVLVCLPPEAIVPWVKTHASPVLRVTHAQECAREGAGATFQPNTLVVDICGTKRGICAEMAKVPQDGWRFIGGHPMAGREVSGYANSKADLFVGASMILTPVEAASASRQPPLPAALDALRDFFRAVGFHETVVTTPEKHDDMIAFTSQLCHAIATSYARDPRVADAVGFSAGSYANMTRIATQDAAVWSALYSENRDVLVPVLDGFLSRVQELRDAIAADDSATVVRLIEEGTKAKREELLARRRGDETESAPVRRIGLYGGSFNPVHCGHVRVAEAALRELNLDRLIVLPAAVSPFKTGAASVETPDILAAHRLEMVHDVFDGLPRTVVDERELKRGGVSYAIDTVREIRNEYAASSNSPLELFFIIGEDSVEGLPRWKDIDELKKLCTFKVFPRTKESSTEIRRLFAAADVRENADAKMVSVVRAGLKRKGGYCPCRLQKTPEFFCPCDEFKEQLADPNYHGLCHCRLYEKR